MRNWEEVEVGIDLVREVVEKVVKVLKRKRKKRRRGVVEVE